MVLLNSLYVARFCWENRWPKCSPYLWGVTCLVWQIPVIVVTVFSARSATVLFESIYEFCITTMNADRPIKPPPSAQPSAIDIHFCHCTPFSSFSRAFTSDPRPVTFFLGFPLLLVPRIRLPPSMSFCVFLDLRTKTLLKKFEFLFK